MFMDRFLYQKLDQSIQPLIIHSSLLGYWGSNPNIQEPESCALPIWLYPSKSPVRELNS